MSTNFVTPHVCKYVQTPDERIVELSQGEGMDGKTVYGVSEFAVEDGRLVTTKRGQMHRSIQSAQKHFNVLLGAN